VLTVLILPCGIAAPLLPNGQLSLMLYSVVILLAGVPFWLNLAGIGTVPIVVAYFTDFVFHSDQALGYSLACLVAVTVPFSAWFFHAGLKPFRSALAQGEF
jgi:hypothetical protein